MTLFRIVAPRHIYCNYLKVMVRTVAKHAHLNQAINTQTVKN